MRALAVVGGLAAIVLLVAPILIVLVAALAVWLAARGLRVTLLDPQTESTAPTGAERSTA